MNATAKQLQYIHAALHKKQLLKHKAEMVASFTNGRTESSREMTAAEADELLRSLNDHQPEADAKDKMIRKIIAMAREMGVVTREPVVGPDGKVKQKSNYTRLNHWMLQLSYLKKPLNQYSYAELPKLVTQYTAVYMSWLKK